MRVLLQRVKEAYVNVDGATVGSIATGMVVLVGVTSTDTRQDADYLVEKIINLRIFPDEARKMNRSLLEASGALLVVSQFTLYGDCKKGRRPSFDTAAPPDLAHPQVPSRARAPLPLSPGRNRPEIPRSA